MGWKEWWSKLRGNSVSGLKNPALVDSPIPSSSNLPPCPWVEVDVSPWGVRVLDVRPITLGMLSTSQDPQMAANAASYGREDGRGFITQVPPVERIIEVDIHYPLAGSLAEGVLFNPRMMEHKWALYYYNSQIWFIRSWQRSVRVVADVAQDGRVARVTHIRGAFFDEPPELTSRIADFLIRTHALGEHFPAPLPVGMSLDPSAAGLWCFSNFGNMAIVAVEEPFAAAPPNQPLRSSSLLHIAAAQGEIEKVRQAISDGLSWTLLAADGMSVLHWALVRNETDLIQALIESGCPVDPRSDQGATPLMNAVQARSVPLTTVLLDLGADPNAADNRNFTSLHRAAEMGEIELVRLLLARGAFRHPEAMGHTPLSIAKQRGEAQLVALLSE